MPTYRPFFLQRLSGVRPGNAERLPQDGTEGDREGDQDIECTTYSHYKTASILSRMIPSLYPAHTSRIFPSFETITKVGIP